MPCPRNLKTETLIAEAADEIARRRPRRPLVLVGLHDW